MELFHAAQETDKRLNFSIRIGIKNTSNVDEIAAHQLLPTCRWNSSSSVSCYFLLSWAIPPQLNFAGKQEKQIGTSNWKHIRIHLFLPCPPPFLREAALARPANVHFWQFHSRNVQKNLSSSEIFPKFIYCQSHEYTKYVQVCTKIEKCVLSMHLYIRKM